MKFHLIPNSHLDPVWLWDWREGLNEGVITCRTILRLMEEFPFLTYIRGESAIYEHIQRYDPATFAKIRERIAEGRWEVVGGTVVQPDTNLPATETLIRHFTAGLRYFETELGRRPAVAWAADSFGHSAGLPEILAAAGMSAFAFSRPMEQDFHLPKPAFWWEGAGGSRILSWRIPVGWYGTHRDEIIPRLDETRSRAGEWGLQNVAVFVGLGNHGGGPSRRHLEDIAAWAARNPDIEVAYSGLAAFFEALREENAELPVIRGELNFTLRGCYSSAARFKALYRKTENHLFAVEKTQSIIAAACGGPMGELSEAWQSVLFNAFHDILPGSSIERAYHDQSAWLGVAWHQAQRAELGALSALSAQIDTLVEEPEPDMPCAVPLVVWNPHPWEYRGPIELEACVDYRPIAAYKGRPLDLPVEVLDANGDPLPFQRVDPENYFAPDVPWRIRIVTTALCVPAMGWQVVRMAWKNKPRLADPGRGAPAVAGKNEISNAQWRVTARAGSDRIDVMRNGEALFGSTGLRVASYEDPYGSWGGHDGEREADSINEVKEYWKVQRVEVIRRGPEQASLWVRLASEKSRLELTASLSRGSDQIQWSARLFFDEPGHRVKLLLPTGDDEAEFEVPGGTVRRKECGETPGGRWVRTGAFVFASDSIFDIGMHGQCLGATFVRSTRYACTPPTSPSEMPWRPYMDGGEHLFRFAIAPAAQDGFRLADALEQPVTVYTAAPGAGKLQGTGSLGEIVPSNLRLLALKPAEKGDGWILRVQETAGRGSAVTIRIGAERIAVGQLGAWQLGTWRLSKRFGTWVATPTDASELPIREKAPDVDSRAVEIAALAGASESGFRSFH